MGRGKKKGKRAQTKYTDRSSELEMSNERFEKYYKTQQILSEDEWDAFINALRQPLPSTFRIAAHRQMKDVLTDAIKNKFVPQLVVARLDGEPLPVPQPIQWYPDGLAWHVGLARKELKRSPEYKKFHEFLVYETEVGNISRQEAVSMLPPLFLDVRPHHNVIDLCAAPGSKTSQLLEAMDPPTGLLIANDSDQKRAHLLVHQSSRLPSPGLMVTNLDASIFPSLKYNEGTLRFDRILADVPCSGDGTLRKNVGIWAKWNPMEANGLHSLQLRILQRAMRMLKHDTTMDDDDKPRIVFSTCSLNPVENEAVVAAALNTIPGFELVDASEVLPALDRRPGISSWRPAVDRDMNMSYASYKEYCDNLDTLDVEPTSARGKVRTGESKDAEDFKECEKKVEGRMRNRQGRNKMLKTHWPPENVQELHLERCIRIYPHLQNTGGFFVAVLQRRASLPLISTQPRTDLKRVAEVQERKEAPRSTPDGGPAAKKVKLSTHDLENVVGLPAVDVGGEAESSVDSVSPFKEDPYTFVSPDDPILVACIERLKLSGTFPRSNLFVRNAEGTPIRSLYLVNDAVRSVMSQTDYRKIRLISAGVKIFGRSELGNTKRYREEAIESAGTVQFRVLHEGLLALLQYIDRELVLVGAAKELRTLLEAYYPLCSSFEEPFQKNIESCYPGSHVIRFRPGDYGQASLSHDLFLPLWKSEVSVSLMVDKRVKSALSLRFFGEDITVAGRQAAKRRDEGKVEAGDGAVIKNSLNSDDDQIEGSE